MSLCVSLLLGKSGQLSYFAFHGLTEIIQKQVALSALTQCLGVALEGSWVLSCLLEQRNCPLADFLEVCCIVLRILWPG